MHKIVFAALIAFPAVLAEAAGIPAAVITCARQIDGDVVSVNGGILFRKGYEFYGPATNKFVGWMNFRFADGSNDPGAKTQVHGTQLRRARHGEPDFWFFTAISEKGEVIQMNLRSEGSREGHFFGEIERQDGQSFSAHCQIQLQLPEPEGPRSPSRGRWGGEGL